jgi:riboflavin synthase
MLSLQNTKELLKSNNMFTGIIEAIGTITNLEAQDSNITYTIKSPISQFLKIDQSVAHNGVCLTVIACGQESHQVTAIAETIAVTNLKDWKIDAMINVERAMPNNARLDGHFVQGHVDATMQCTSVLDKNGSWEYTFVFDDKFASLVIEKGSICINGISLTCFAITDNSLQVAIIPYTYNNTNIQHIQVGNLVNVEFDILGKYIARHTLLQQKGLSV